MMIGHISVFETTDDWKSATYRGMVMNDDPNVGKGYPTATVQVVDSIYISEFYLDVVVSEEFAYTAGNRNALSLLEKVWQMRGQMDADAWDFSRCFRLLDANALLIWENDLTD
ncbi:hypothetical protein GGI42DRAFT_352139 [Trichoderma sp. SZMC 28013]